jgi:site-specific DNA-methyltransferase (adenine-specific)
MADLYNGDCIEILKKLPNNSVDCILCDPPYGTTSLSWDSIIPLNELWIQLKRIRKSYCPIVMFASQPFTTTLINSNIGEFKYCLVWEKTKAANFQQAPNMPLKKHEDIVVFSDGVVGHVSQTNRRMTYNPQGVIEVDRFVKRNKVDDPHGFYRENGVYKGYKQNFTNYPSSVLKFGNSHNPNHPTQKPIDLMEFLVNSYSNSGDIVLDFTMGSGSTGVAAIKNNRKFIGIELEKKYFDIAKTRIDEIENINNIFEME